MLVCSLPARAQDELAKVMNFRIAAQPLPAALIAFSEQSSVQVMTDGRNLTELASPGVVGRMPVEAALQTLLKGTHLGYARIGHSTVAITEPSEPASMSSTEQPASSDTAQESSGDATAGASNYGEIVVVGSRLSKSAKDSAVPVNVYSREKIDRSGASSVADFLNTLPEVSVQTTTTGNIQQFAGASTVQLRGLPSGTTLVLINGRRLQSSTGSVAGHQGFFDLNSLPVAAIDRIEVLPTGSSAIYGGDALGGVVNIVLKKGYDGLALDARYGATGDGRYNETQYSLYTGRHGDDWSVSALATYGKSSELSGNERKLTSSADYTKYGGLDYRTKYGNPGDVCTQDGSNLTGLGVPCAGIPAGPGIGLSPTDFSTSLNLQSSNAFGSIMSPGEHFGAYIEGSFRLSPGIEMFAEVLYSHTDLNAYFARKTAVVNIADDNPINPFGQDVAVQYTFYSTPRRCYCSTSDFFRPLIGFRGTFAEHWSWELAGWTSRDWEHVPDNYGFTNSDAINAAVAEGSFNPFTNDAAVPRDVIGGFFDPQSQKMRGASDSVNAFVRGPLFDLPAGAIEAVVGGEYQHDRLAWDVEQQTQFNIQRESEAAFVETRIPILSDPMRRGTQEVLTAQAALRYDRYSDFGSRSSPQFGLEYRPISSLLLRTSYGSAFKPPSLYNSHGPKVSYSGIEIQDPLRGNETETIDITYGGNPELRPETGWSRNFGIVWSPESVRGLDVSISAWSLHLKNGFTQPQYTYYLANEATLSSHVVRADPEPGDPYGVGVITELLDTYLNFGHINEDGVDFSTNWKLVTSAGIFTPSLALTETYHYDFQSTPDAPSQNAVSQANSSSSYAPRWKGTVALGWSKDALSAGIDGRYIGAYDDVTDLRADPRSLGNFWYVDLNGRFEVGRVLFPDSRLLAKAYVSAGVRNLLDKKPEYSDFNSGYYGYDSNEYDIIGRYLWAQVGVSL